MYFYMAAVGEVRWKECLSKEEGRIGSNTMEAFALLVLVNNYKAWLYEEKKPHQTNLFTEYDSPPSYKRPSIVDKILDGVQFNLEMEATSPNVIYDKGDRTYKKLEQERVKWLEAFCKTERSVQTKNGVLKKASTDTSDESLPDAEETADADLFVLKERAKKRRKLTRELREFTGVSSQGERKHKGWSDEGMVTFEKFVEAIKKDVEEGKYVAWEKAYREVMVRLGGHAKKGNADEPLPQARYEPNLSLVYEGF
jgi:anti-sigma28 factor (negative regulator of flagellin synthesis)